jgi:hypothetical protein
MAKRGMYGKEATRGAVRVLLQGIAQDYGNSGALRLVAEASQIWAKDKGCQWALEIVDIGRLPPPKGSAKPKIKAGPIS